MFRGGLELRSPFSGSSLGTRSLSDASIAHEIPLSMGKGARGPRPHFGRARPLRLGTGKPPHRGSRCPARSLGYPRAREYRRGHRPGPRQGLTEFLPISSSGHLRIVPAIFGWEDPGAGFTAVIQLGTMAAVLLYFRADIWRITKPGSVSSAARAASSAPTRSSGGSSPSARSRSASSASPSATRSSPARATST